MSRNEGRRVGLRIVFALPVLVLVGPSAATPEACSVLTSLPARISSPGNYCLASTLRLETPAEAAISVEADSVVLDLGGQALEAGSGVALRKLGIYVAERQRVTLRNGVVRGFDRGVVLAGPAGGSHLVERLRIEDSRLTGLTLEGRGNLARKNRLLGSGGVGIRVSGPLARVLASEVRDTGVLGWRGVVVDGADGAVIEGNRIGSQGRPLQTVGIEVSGSKDVLLVNNDVANVAQRVRWGAESTGTRRDLGSAARSRTESK